MTQFELILSKKLCPKLSFQHEWENIHRGMPSKRQMTHNTKKVVEKGVRRNSYIKLNPQDLI